MAKCRPHHWRMPKVGDDAVVCEVCGRELLYGQITPNMRASIVNGYERRVGDCHPVVDEFSSALYAAEEDARRRGWPAIPERPLPKRERSALEETMRDVWKYRGPLPKRER